MAMSRLDRAKSSEDLQVTISLFSLLTLYLQTTVLPCPHARREHTSSERGNGWVVNTTNGNPAVAVNEALTVDTCSKARGWLMNLVHNSVPTPSASSNRDCRDSIMWASTM